jgi:hypothetical protein
MVVLIVRVPRNASWCVVFPSDQASLGSWLISEDFICRAAQMGAKTYSSWPLAESRVPTSDIIKNNRTGAQVTGGTGAGALVQRAHELKCGVWHRRFNPAVLTSSQIMLLPGCSMRSKCSEQVAVAWAGPALKLGFPCWLNTNPVLLHGAHVASDNLSCRCDPLRGHQGWPCPSPFYSCTCWGARAYGLDSVHELWGGDVVPEVDPQAVGTVT